MANSKHFKNSKNHNENSFSPERYSPRLPNQLDIGENMRKYKYNDMKKLSSPRS